jgi:membrane-bound lytic murein transglycosylase C
MDQIKDPEGKTITGENAEEYVEKYLAQEIKVEKMPVVGSDGKRRLKAKARIMMVPEHLRIRAERYRKEVNEYAGRYGLDPELLYAVIHTESYFNPLAISPVPAFGLMQLVPKAGAMDAYRYLYNEKKLLSAAYLYNPVNNIMLGATYLYLLQNRYLAGVEDLNKRRLLSIAAYNWGPGNIRKYIVRKNKVDDLDRRELMEIINRVAPVETRDYIRKVQKRMGLYREM